MEKKIQNANRVNSFFRSSYWEKLISPKDFVKYVNQFHEQGGCHHCKQPLGLSERKNTPLD